MEDSLLSCLKAWLVYIYVLARSFSLISGYQSLDFLQYVNQFHLEQAYIMQVQGDQW